MLVISFLEKKGFSFFIQILPKIVCIELLYAVLSAFVDIVFYIQAFKLKVKKTQKISLVILLGVSKFLTYLIIPSPYCKFVELPIAFCIIKFVLKQSNEKAILGETLNSIVVVTLETVFAKILSIDLRLSYLKENYNFTYILILKASVILSRLIFVFVLKKKNLYIPLSNHLRKRNKNSIYIISLLGLAIIIVTQLELLYTNGIVEYLTFLLNVSLYVYVCIENILKVDKLEMQKLKIDSLEAYNKTLSLMYDSIRGFKHDFSNFVLALDGYVETENINGIRKMSKAILQDCATVNKMGILDPKVINNSAIYSIVTNKYYLAKEQNLIMNIEVLSKIDENRENNYEICRILGILLDNAIEAAKETEEKIINVRFIGNDSPKRSLVIVENSYKNKTVDIDKIFEKGYTSKENCSKKEHGLGLWNIRNILMTNEDLNLYTTADKLFRQQLEIY